MSRKPRVDEIAIILACRQQGCAWDYVATGWYVTFNRYGYRRWERTAQCLRGCESTQIQVMEPWLGGRRLSSKVKHTEAWHELKGFYWGEAREESLRRQVAAIGGPQHLEVVHPINFKGEKIDPAPTRRTPARKEDESA